MTIVWDADGWSDFDWAKVGNVSGDLMRTATDLDAAYGGGGGGCSPRDLDDYIGQLDNALRRLREVRANYLVRSEKPSITSRSSSEDSLNSTTDDRKAAVVNLRSKGKTYREIGAELDISIERARQILLGGGPGAVSLAQIPWAASVSPNTRRLLVRLGYLTASSVVEAVRSGKLHCGCAYGMGAVRFAEIQRLVEVLSKSSDLPASP